MLEAVETMDCPGVVLFTLFLLFLDWREPEGTVGAIPPRFVPALWAAGGALPFFLDGAFTESRDEVR